MCNFTRGEQVGDDGGEWREEWSQEDAHSSHVDGDVEEWLEIEVKHSF